MKIIQGYKGSYLGSGDRQLMLEASAWQWKKFNPEDELVLYCPRKDSKIAFRYETGYRGPWDSICVLPDETVHKLYDTGRYEIMSVQDEDFGWLDPDTITFERVPDLVPGEVDFIGYGDEGKENIYPFRQERWFRDFLDKFPYCYNYEKKAYNMGFFKVTAELGVIIGLECRRALDFFMKQGVTYYEPSDVKLHHFCSQAVPALVIDRFHKNYKCIDDYFPDLDHPAVWHLVHPFIVMPNGDQLWSSKRQNERVGFWKKLYLHIIDERGISWNEFVEFYMNHKDDKVSIL